MGITKVAAIAVVVAAIAVVTAVSALGTTAAASAHTVLPPPLVGSFPAATSYTVAAGTSTTFQAQYSAVRPVGTLSVRTTGQYATASPSSIHIRVFGPQVPVTVTISVPADAAAGSVSDTLVATHAQGWRKAVTYAFTVVVPVDPTFCSWLAWTPDINANDPVGNGGYANEQRVYGDAARASYGISAVLVTDAETALASPPPGISMATAWNAMMNAYVLMGQQGTSTTNPYPLDIIRAWDAASGSATMACTTG